MKTLPEITAGAEEGFVDLNFLAQWDVAESEGLNTVTATGLYCGAEVGFTIHIGDAWTAEEMDQGMIVRWGKIRLIARGEISDRMIRTLDRLYETVIGPTRMASTGELTAVALSGDPNQLRRSPVKIKLFFCDDGPDDRYGEVYLNIDLAVGRIEFHEKDPDYRRAIVLALSQDAG